MTIAVASGKGGTGKTTVAVGLALSVDGPVTLLDCDVEEPNAHIFVKPEGWTAEEAVILKPETDEKLCRACGACAKFCAFHARAIFPQGPLFFSELCHGCGGCALVCPNGAIREVPARIGEVRSGKAGDLTLLDGLLDIGQPMAPPLIRAVKSKKPQSGVTFIDCPPGAACSMVTAVKGADYVLFVLEPTPFGLHDLGIVAEAVKELGIPAGVVINKSDSDDGRAVDFCRRKGLPIHLSIPEERHIAEGSSIGKPLTAIIPAYKKIFRAMFGEIAAVVKGEGR